MSRRLRSFLPLLAAGVLTFDARSNAGNGPEPADFNANWPQWRGAGGQGVGTGSYPAAWSATEHIAWKAAIAGRGHSSPVVWGDRIYVTSALEGAEIPGRKAPDHLGFDLKPGYGKEVWRSPRRNRRSWATPIVVSADGRDELIASGAEAIVAYDPLTGTELWRTDGTQSHPIPSFVTARGLVLATAGSQAKVALAIRPGAAHQADRIAWRHNKGTAYVASPIAVGDYFHVISDGGIMTCLDAATGAVVYEGGRVPVPATVRAWPVAFGDRILITSEDGETFVIRAGRTHEVLRTNSVDEPVWASPALANGTIYIRGERHLFAIR